MPVAPWQSLRLPPRIDEGYSRRLEISDVAGDHRHAMHEGSSKWAENGFCRSKHKRQAGLCCPKDSQVLQCRLICTYGVNDEPPIV